MKPFNAMRLRKPSGAGGGPIATSFVAASGTTYATATTAAATIPAATAAGDLLLAWIFCRDTLTPPAGWSLVISVRNVLGGTDQTTLLYSKTADSGDIGASPTWTQASAVRIAVHYHVLRGVGGTPRVLNSAADLLSSALSNRAMLVLNGTAANQIGVACVNPAIADAVNPATVSSPFVLTTPTAPPDNRLFVAYRALNASSSTNGNFILGGNTDCNRISAVIG